MSEKPPLVSTDLALYAPETILDQAALGAALGVSPRTLRRMVARLEIPPGLPLGGKKVWLAGKVREFLALRAENVVRRSQRSREEVMSLRTRRDRGAN